MRRRRMGTEGAGALTERLLQEDQSQTTTRNDQQIIVYQGPFRLEAWLECVYRSWCIFLSALATCLSSVLPSMSKDPELSLIQVQQVEELQEKASQPFNGEDPEHQQMLTELWSYAFPGVACTTLKSPQWKEMGWQGEDPGTDFRGAGVFGLENLLYMARQHPATFQRLLSKEDGVRADWEYPFAVAGLNLTFMLVDLFGLQVRNGGAPHSRAGHAFVQLLSDSPNAFEETYIMAFQVLDATWLEMGASYMEFQQVMKKTRAQLEQALVSRPASLSDLRQRLRLQHGRS